ncbi:MAG: phosphonate ABC transporter ATP-binding protein [Zoogloeaceae bacterium]|jgi:phosphonate transport system ATP-binding protein|nr:phosphonate ABC transporter ATP-binding protein [Zoogloeaceae bacterium]
MQDYVIRVSELNKTFGSKQVLFDLSLDIARGEMVALIGSSGSGKSTLLRHLSGLTRADARGHRQRDESGHIHVMGDVIQQSGRLSRNVRRQRSRIGYVFQQFNLVGRLSVMENVLLGHLGRIPRWRGACRLFSASERNEAMASLRRVGMAEYSDRRASTLSGGQQQRVAIARALTQRAEVILADEPIASLDPESAKNVMDILANINATDKTTVIVSLHQIDYARAYCPRTVALKKGGIHFDGATHSLCDTRLSQIYGAEAPEIVTPPHGNPVVTVHQMAVA